MGKLQKKKDHSKKKKQLEAGVNSGTTKAVNKNIGGVSSRIKKNLSAASSKIVKKEDVSGIRRYLDDGVQFLREVRVELKKVTWPSRQQTIGSTAVVIVLVFIVSFFLGLVDVGLSNLIKVVLG